MILIITHKMDYTVDYVVEKLNQLGHKYYRYNTEDIIQKRDVEIRLGIQSITRFGPTDNINAVWYRRIRFPQFYELNDEIREYIHSELHSFLNNVWCLMNVKWLSKPENINRAENKLLQLKEAIKLGFTIPETLITFDNNSIREFYDANNKHIIIKPIFNKNYNDEVSEKVIYTNMVSEDFIERLDEYVPIPSIYQQYIDKEYEIRVTVVGNKAFSAYVDSQSNNNTIVDWRKEKLKFYKYKLPNEITTLCIQLVKNLHLSFGAIDIIKDKNGNYTFLEINPNGQWAWIEKDTGLPISDTIIEFLTT